MITIEQKKEIVNDIINFLNNEVLEDLNDIIHIDNLKEEVEEENENFNYSIEDFNTIYNSIFN